MECEQHGLPRTNGAIWPVSAPLRTSSLHFLGAGRQFREASLVHKQPEVSDTRAAIHPGWVSSYGSSVADYVPEGRLKIAQRFIAGWKGHMAPGVP
jgi:hypothetical protein